MCRAGIVVAGSAPPEEQSGDGDSPVSEESAQVVIPEGETEDGYCELRVGITEAKESPSENGGNSAEPCKNDEVDEAQPMRRSASMDCLSASVIIADIANSHSGEFEVNSISQLGKVESKLGIVAKKVDDNQSLFLMKRSFSCSGKVLLSRYNPSQELDSTLLRIFFLLGQVGIEISTNSGTLHKPESFYRLVCTHKSCETLITQRK
ncbi:hypothetical protein Acr_07g0002830 [Actinidia rufa]|uniref:Uncharacterized protein n=1 Tax=Actinidia rufa TaxID=165716 RepID=A0A7J0EV23_9ERIC|nr:hypothetical protein Acr_07g0002830 [Actinidia rufa]